MVISSHRLTLASLMLKGRSVNGTPCFSASSLTASLLPTPGGMLSSVPGSGPHGPAATTVATLKSLVCSRMKSPTSPGLPASYHFLRTRSYSSLSTLSQIPLRAISSQVARKLGVIRLAIDDAPWCVWNVTAHSIGPGPLGPAHRLVLPALPQVVLHLALEFGRHRQLTDRLLLPLVLPLDVAQEERPQHEGGGQEPPFDLLHLFVVVMHSLCSLVWTSQISPARRQATRMRPAQPGPMCGLS